MAGVGGKVFANYLFVLLKFLIILMCFLFSQELNIPTKSSFTFFCFFLLSHKWKETTCIIFLIFKKEEKGNRGAPRTESRV